MSKDYFALSPVFKAAEVYSRTLSSFAMERRPSTLCLLKNRRFFGVYVGDAPAEIIQPQFEALVASHDTS